MADIIDSASEIEELQRNTAIKMRRLNYQTVSATHCCECGDPGSADGIHTDSFKPGDRHVERRL